MSVERGIVEFTDLDHRFMPVVVFGDKLLVIGPSSIPEDERVLRHRQDAVDTYRAAVDEPTDEIETMLRSVWEIADEIADEIAQSGERVVVEFDDDDSLTIVDD